MTKETLKMEDLTDEEKEFVMFLRRCKENEREGIRVKRMIIDGEKRLVKVKVLPDGTEEVIQ